MIHTKALSIGYSPCPNDTYIFYALAHGKISLDRVRFAEPLLEDVETLNGWSLSARLDVTKLSFHALGHVTDKYILLRSGSALGRGCGPLLVTSDKGKPGNLAQWTIAIPGEYTTAALLLKLYAPQCINFEIMRFDAIMDAVKAGQVDGGIIIHEGRFTYEDIGLECLQDLGLWWEETTGLPIPLGCIAARADLSVPLLEEIDWAIAESIRYARKQPERCHGYIKVHAQELSDSVVQEHIDLYVNDFSIDLGDDGRAAIDELFRRGQGGGVFAKSCKLQWRE